MSIDRPINRAGAARQARRIQQQRQREERLLRRLRDAISDHPACRARREVLAQIVTYDLTDTQWMAVLYLASMFNEGGTTTPDLLRFISDAFQPEGEG